MAAARNTDACASQELFHAINLQYPGLRLIHSDPYIFAIDSFASADECLALRELLGSGTAHSSATATAQAAVRTSTTVFPPEAQLLWLRTRIAVATNVSLEQFEPTKLTIYHRGEHFRKHIDASFLNEKMWGFAARLAGVDDDGVQDPCSWPSRCCTFLLFLNDVDSGGRTCFRWLDGSGSMPGGAIFMQSLEKLSEQEALIDGAAIGEGDSAQQHQTAELNIVPRAGLAIIHFPSTRLKHGCIPDPRTMHESEDAIDTKAILQQFIWPCPIQRPPHGSQQPPVQIAVGHHDDERGVVSVATSESEMSEVSKMSKSGPGNPPSASQQWHGDVLAEWQAIFTQAGQ